MRLPPKTHLAAKTFIASSCLVDCSIHFALLDAMLSSLYW